MRARTSESTGRRFDQTVRSHGDRTGNRRPARSARARRPRARLQQRHRRRPRAPFARRWLAACPLERLGTTRDVADAVLFLLSDAARWISGATLVVDGGMLARPTW